MSRSLLVLTAALALMLAGSLMARAGLADSGIPRLQGQKAVHLYSVPGIVNGNNLGTYFSCTSTGTVLMWVAVELFQDAAGAPLNDASGTALSVAPGATVTFGTSLAFRLGLDENLGAPEIANGSARILATSKALVCTAFVAEGHDLPLIAKSS
jgi:hypothetical protein